jgi:glycerophosphoryl diester phosphodiesterase
MIALLAAALIANPHASVGALLDCLDDRATLVSAHRGGPGPGYPENALETFEHTLAAGPMILEVDVRLTRDGDLVLMHDATLERTTTGSGRVRDRTAAEITALRLKDPAGAVTGFAPPRLTEALAWARGRTLLQLDVKETAALPAIVAAVNRAGAHAYVALVLYTAQDAALAARLDPRLTLHATVERPEALAELQRLGAPADRINAWTGTGPARPALWRELDRQGVPVVYGVLGARDQAIAMSGSDAHYAALARQGVDVLATDRPAEAFAALGGARTRQALKACRALR